ncbi:DNA-binding protein [Radiobacillus sp. PE A8.2]|uniref:DNA-binding protein n=1 Tax=Radiobacillus sp. PE A8.2 TaxID=3380349 RepID=UPI00388F575B
MDFNFFWFAIGLAAMGYFIGEGLKNFGNADSKSLLNFDVDDNEPWLIKEKDLHWNIDIDKADIPAFLEKYPDIPMVELNGQRYFPKKQLMEWLENKL